MEIRVIGDARDTTGFALAGVDGVECRTHAEVTAVLARWARDSRVAIIAVGEGAAALAPDEIAGLRGAVDGPIVVLLPGPPTHDAKQRATA